MSRESGTLYVGNLPGDVGKQEVEDVICNGHKIEKSVNDVMALAPGIETACSISSVNGSVPDTKETILHKYDNEKSLEMEKSSECTDSLISVADSGITLTPIESDANIAAIAGEDKTAYMTSPPIKNVAANTHEVIKPQTGNSDKVATGSAEDDLDLTAEQGTEHVPSFLTGNEDATIEEATEHRTEAEHLESSVSSLISCSRLQHKTEQVNDTTDNGGNCISSSADKQITSMDFELKISCPQPSENTEEFTLVANSGIVHGAVGSNENVLDSASECETNFKGSMENVAADTPEIIETETLDSDSAAVGCAEEALLFARKHEQEQLSSCLTGNDVSTVREVIQQETEVENLEGVVSTPLNCLELKPITEHITDTAVTVGDTTTCSMDRANGGVDFELETSGPQSFESSDSLTVVADSSIVQRPLGSDERILVTSKENETKCRHYPPMENAKDHTHETIEPETGDAANVTVGCVEDALLLTTEHGTEQMSCLTGNDGSTVTKVILEQETEVENHETPGSPVNCSKLNPLSQVVNGNSVVEGDGKSCLIHKVVSSMDFEVETTCNHSSESSDSLTVVDIRNIVQSPVECDEGNLDTARKHENHCRTSPSIEDVAANAHEIIKLERGDSDNVAVGFVKDSTVLPTESGMKQVSFCLTGNDTSTLTKVTEQEMDVGNFEGAVSTPVISLRLKPTAELLNGINIAGDDNTSNSTDKMISNTDIEFEEKSPQSFEDSNSLMVVADTKIIETPVDIYDSKLHTSGNHETQCMASLSTENVAGITDEIIRPETVDADNIDVGCVEDAPVFATKFGTEQMPSCLIGNDDSTLTKVSEREMGVNDFEGADSTPASCLKLKPTVEVVNDIGITGGGNNKVMSNTEIEFEETPNPQSSESTNRLMVVVDSNTIQHPVESDETSHKASSKHETEYKASPSMENVTANTHEIIKPETEDSDKAAVECVEGVLHPTKEQGPEHLFSCFTGNETPNSEDLIDQETENENSEGAVSSPTSSLQLKPKGHVNHSTVVGGGNPNCSTDKLISCMEVDPETSGAQDASSLHVDDDHIKPKISIVDDVQTVPFRSEKESDVGNHSVINSREDMLCGDVSPESEVSDSFITKDKLPDCVPDNLNQESKFEHLDGADVNRDDTLACQVTNEEDDSLKNGKSTPFLGNSSAGAVALHDFEPLTRPFRYLVRMPRFEDSRMREQIRKAQLLVEEKTQHRDAFRIEVQKYKANCRNYAAEYETAMSESRTLKKSVRSKRAEIESLQSLMNKVMNAITVDEVDNMIHTTEHMIEHETLPLKQEKQLIRDIKRMKQAREHLSSNIGSHDELQQALNNRDQIGERLKVLKKELESLKDHGTKGDVVVKALEKKYEDENRRVKEVQARYAAANNVRQDAYAHLQSLRRQLFEKNQRFRMYKDSVAAAADFAAKQDREGLHHICVNQVESFMELWNQNNEFRKEYARCNMKSTLRRLGTMDGRSLGPNEQPHVFTSYGGERVNQLVCEPINSRVDLQMENLEQDVLEPIQNVAVDGRMKVKKAEKQIPATGTGKLKKNDLRNELPPASGREISEEDVIREEQHIPKQEENDAIRKDEELRKEEAEAKLREQRRLEEKAKALEALERKKKNAEKAQMKAELRAQKEAELREKEKEKRLRKKERRKGGAVAGAGAGAGEVSDGSNSTETASNCESMMSEITLKEHETKENPVAVTKRHQKVSQFTKQSKAKSIPPPLRNRNRKKIQQWMWVILTCGIVIALFLLGNVGFFSNLSNLQRRNSGF